jgi:hypothetical protein
VDYKNDQEDCRSSALETKRLASRHFGSLALFFFFG